MAIDDSPYRGARTPYILNDRPPCKLQHSSGEYHINWSCGELDFVPDCRIAADCFQEELSISVDTHRVHGLL